MVWQRFFARPRMHQCVTHSFKRLLLGLTLMRQRDLSKWVRRCYTVVRRPLPEASWNLLQLPITANVVEVQRWQVSPIYYWFEQCTCTKVR